MDHIVNNPFIIILFFRIFKTIIILLKEDIDKLKKQCQRDNECIGRLMKSDLTQRNQIDAQLGELDRLKFFNVLNTNQINAKDTTVRLLESELNSQKVRQSEIELNFRIVISNCHVVIF